MVQGSPVLGLFAPAPGAVHADPTRYPCRDRVRGAAVFYRLRYPPKVSREEWLAEKSESR
jgi:hypothetical protein